MGCGSSVQGPEQSTKPSESLFGNGDKSAKPSNAGTNHSSKRSDMEKLTLVEKTRNGVQPKARAGKNTVEIQEEGQNKIYKPLRRGSYSSNPTGVSEPEGKVNGETMVQAIAAVDVASERPPNPFVQSQLPNVMFLAHLDDSVLDRIARMFELVSYNKDDFVIKQGAKGTHMYVVKSGKLRGWSSDEPGKTYVAYSPNQIFGELTYLFPSKKTFLNITAEEASELYRIEHEALRTLIRADQILKMKKYDDLLTKCDIFKMERDRRLKLVELMTVVEQAYGDELAKAGSHLDKMLPESVIWVVEEGGLEVSIEVDGRMEPVYSVGPGEYFPTYLIDDVEHLRWTASVATTAPSKIIVVEQTAVAVVDPDLWKRCQDDPLAISTVRKFTEKVEELRAGGREVQFVPKTKPRAIWDPEPV